jgi:hypothetical protein
MAWGTQLCYLAASPVFATEAAVRIEPALCYRVEDIDWTQNQKHSTSIKQQTITDPLQRTGGEWAECRMHPKAVAPRQS